MIKLINKIFNFDFFDDIDDGDVYIAITEQVLLHTNSCSTWITTSKQSPIYRHIELVRQAIKSY